VLRCTIIPILEVPLIAFHTTVLTIYNARPEITKINKHEDMFTVRGINKLLLIQCPDNTIFNVVFRK